jgi:hypothetical protein
MGFAGEVSNLVPLVSRTGENPCHGRRTRSCREDVVLSGMGCQPMFLSRNHGRAARATAAPADHVPGLWPERLGGLDGDQVRLDVEAEPGGDRGAGRIEQADGLGGEGLIVNPLE